MSLVARRIVLLLLAGGLGLSTPLGAARPAPLPCAAEALAATAAIRTLVSVLGLPDGLQNALDSKLDAAEQSVGNDNASSAAGQLGALRNQAQALVAAGDIGAADAQALLDAIDAALAVVETCSGVPRLEFFNVRAGDSENTLFWVNPAMPGYARTLILYRTDAYPTGPADSAATVLGSFSGAPGDVGSASHPGLDNGTTYYYAAFAQDVGGLSSAARTSRGRPDDSSTPFLWAYTVGRSLPIAGVFPNVLYSAFSDDGIHALRPGAAGGGWPPGWKPARIPAPPDTRPSGPLTLTMNGGPTSILFAPSRTGRMFAVDATTGGILWTSPDLGGAVSSSPSGASVSTPWGSLFLLFVGVKRPDGSGAFYALRGADGGIAWSFDAGGALGAVTTQPAAGTQSRVYFTSRAWGSADTVWCLRYTDTSATVAWSAQPGDVDTSPTTRSPALYVATSAGEVHALDLDTGAPLWSVPYSTGDGAVSRFVFADRFSRRVYLSTAHQAQALEDTGTAALPVWSIPLPSPSVPAPYIDGTYNDVYVAAGDGRLYIVDGAATTAPVPAFVTVGDPANPSALGQLTFDSRLNIVTTGSADGVVYALKVPFTSFAPPAP